MPPCHLNIQSKIIFVFISAPDVVKGHLNLTCQEGEIQVGMKIQSESSYLNLLVASVLTSIFVSPTNQSKLIAC